MTDAAAQTELLRVAFQRLGRAAQQTAASLAEASAAADQQLSPWRGDRGSFIVPSGPTIGRKRRARRARGQRIEARRNPPYVGGWIWRAGAGLHSKQINPTTRVFNVEIPTCIDDSFLNPSLGEPWEDWADA